MSSERTEPSRHSGLPVRAVRVQVVEGPDRGLTWSDTEAIAIGTAPGNDVVLTDPTVSRYHLELRRRGDRILVVDVGSTNGTEIGPALLHQGEAAAAAGTVISLGKSRLQLDDGDVTMRKVPDRRALGGIRGRSTAIRELIGSVDKLSGSAAPVLLVGESGTGKELIAQALHDHGDRAGQPLVIVDCGAIPGNLFASELFGHERGAFTGADRRSAGAFERAHGGTLLLDEIGELPLEQQVALLGVLERQRIRRVGGDREIPVDVRLLAATNRDLRAEVNSGSFRMDLYYRLAVVRLRVPPLRERPEDIPELVEHFLREEGADERLEEVFSEEAMQRLRHHHWPGNVRELRNVVAAAIAMGNPPELTSLTGPETPQGEGDPIAATLGLTYREARARLLARFEQQYLRALLERSEGNVRQAARLARMDRSYLIELLKRHGLR